MTSIAEHYTEEEREGDDGVQSGIGFAVRSHTVGVDEVLKTSGEPVCTVERGRILVSVNDVEERGYGVAT